MRMLSFTELPERPGKKGGFVQWYQDFLKRTGLDLYRNMSPYPCWACYASGRIIDPKEKPDVVEGHKLSNRINCPKCSGTGKLSAKDYEARFRKDLDNWSIAYHIALAERSKQTRAYGRLIRGVLRLDDLETLGFDIPKPFKSKLKRLRGRPKRERAVRHV